MSKFTPGPWSYDLDEQEVHADDWQQSDGDPAHICQLLGPRKQANGVLIAEAPAMLLALKRAVNYLEGLGSPYNHELLNLKDVIKKAENKE